jgi:trehalose 6-phosphate phosphatase
LERWQGGVAEYFGGVGSYPAKVSRVQDELRKSLDIEGLNFEDKNAALAIHYRNCPDTDEARQAILERVESSSLASDFKIVEGKMVVELRPPVDVNKGTAVRDLIEDYSLKGGIYLGDDMSDLDAFMVMRREGFAAIGVVGVETPVEVEAAVNLTLNGVSDVERFLKWLTDAVSR